MRHLTAVLILGVAWMVSAPAVHAGQCLRDAKSDFLDCKNSCKTDLLDAKAGCANVTPGCYLACRDGKLSCVNDVEQSLNDCIAVCNAPLDAGRDTCKTMCNCASACGFNSCYVQCLDPYQSTAFGCRDSCRDNFKMDANAQTALAACKTGFKACLGGCPTPTP
jgi:hypothetical protein